MRATLSPRPAARALAAGLLLALLVGAAGCKGDPGRGSVKGTITVGGKPLSKGLITFLSETGNKDAFSSAIVNGAYEIPDMTAGRAKIYVIPPQTNAPPAVDKGDLNPVAPPGANTKLAVAEKYHNPATSGLTFDVKKGANEYSTDLTP